MESVNWLVLILRFFHIMAAITAIGGAIFQYFALAPSLGAISDDHQRQQLRERMRSRWAKFVHLSIALLLVTGAINFVLLALPPKVEPMPYHAIFGVKFLLALLVFFIASALIGKSEGFARMRQAARKWLGIVVLLAAVIVILSGLLNQVRTGSKPAEDATPTAPATE